MCATFFLQVFFSGASRFSAGAAGAGDSICGGIMVSGGLFLLLSQGGALQTQSEKASDKPNYTSLYVLPLLK